MATKKIGSAGGGTRDYSTVQAWEDSLVAVLVAQEIGECYNDSEFSVAGAVVTFSGSTTGASTDIILRAAAGQGFRAGVATNAPRYDQTKGVAFKRTGAYGVTVVISEDYVTVQNIQVQNAGGTGDGALDVTDGSVSNIKVIDSLWEVTTVSGAGVWTRFRAGKAWNNLIVSRGSGNGNGVSFDYSGTLVFINNTIVRPSDKTAAGAAFASAGGAITVKNCQVFGFTTIPTSGFTYVTCQTDVATPPTGFTQVTYANQFTTTTDATRDFRTKAGANSIGAGTVDTTSLPDADDIVGTARGASWDVGFFQYVAAGGGGTPDSYIVQFN